MTEPYLRLREILRDCPGETLDQDCKQRIIDAITEDFPEDAFRHAYVDPRNNYRAAFVRLAVKEYTDRARILGNAKTLFKKYISIGMLVEYHPITLRKRVGNHDRSLEEHRAIFDADSLNRFYQMRLKANLPQNLSQYIRGLNEELEEYGYEPLSLTTSLDELVKFIMDSVFDIAIWAYEAHTVSRELLGVISTKPNPPHAYKITVDEFDFDLNSFNNSEITREQEIELRQILSQYGVTENDIVHFMTAITPIPLATYFMDAGLGDNLRVASEDNFIVPLSPKFYQFLAEMGLTIETASEGYRDEFVIPDDPDLWPPLGPRKERLI